MADLDSSLTKTKNLITQSIKEDYYYNNTFIEKSIHRLIYEEQKELYEWLIKQSENSHIMKLIGTYFEFGLGYLKIDYTEALKWYIRAADRKNTNAMNIVASYFIKGKGIGINYVEALNWFQKAVILGDYYAMNNIGLLHKNGLGVNKDNNEALKWFKQASEHGSIDALWNIGILYEMDQNRIEALKYYTIAYHNYKTIKNKTLCKKKIELLMEISDTNIEILQEWILLKDENKTLKDEIEELNTELSYRPEGNGYQQAKDEFESLAHHGEKSSLQK